MVFFLTWIFPSYVVPYTVSQFHSLHAQYLRTAYVRQIFKNIIESFEGEKAKKKHKLFFLFKISSTRITDFRDSIPPPISSLILNQRSTHIEYCLSLAYTFSSPPLLNLPSTIRWLTFSFPHFSFWPYFYFIFFHLYFRRVSLKYVSRTRKNR